MNSHYSYTTLTDALASLQNTINIPINNAVVGAAANVPAAVGVLGSGVATNIPNTSTSNSGAAGLGSIIGLLNGLGLGGGGGGLLG